jgi:FAD binding domain
MKRVRLRSNRCVGTTTEVACGMPELVRRIMATYRIPWSCASRSSPTRVSRTCAKLGQECVDVHVGVLGEPLPSTDGLKVTATALADGFPAPLRLIAATEAGNLPRWVLRDRKPLKQWSKGGITLCGDAAHATSPYAAYGANMWIEDCYFFGRALRGVDHTDLAAEQQPLPSYKDRASRTSPSRSTSRGNSTRSSTTPRHRSDRSATSSSTTPRSCRR